MMQRDSRKCLASGAEGEDGGYYMLHWHGGAAASGGGDGDEDISRQGAAGREGGRGGAQKLEGL